MNNQFIAVSMLTASMAMFSFSNAQAATTAPLEVSVSVSSACTVEVAGVDFGSYDGMELTAAGDVTVTCNDGVPYAIALDAGMNFDGTNRVMANDAGGALMYHLMYAGAAWGDTGITDSYPGDPVSGVGNGGPVSYAVDALLPPDQATMPGMYSDTVTVTVAF